MWTFSMKKSLTSFSSQVKNLVSFSTEGKKSWVIFLSFRIFFFSYYISYKFSAYSLEFAPFSTYYCIQRLVLLCYYSKNFIAGCQKYITMAAQFYWLIGTPYPKMGSYFPLCTNTSILAPAISLTTRLYSHLCSIYNQKYCHFIVVCNMFDQHPTIINNRCMDYTTSARETKTILLFFLIFIVPLCNWSTLQMLNYFMCNLHTM